MLALLLVGTAGLVGALGHRATTTGSQERQSPHGASALPATPPSTDAGGFAVSASSAGGASGAASSGAAGSASGTASANSSAGGATLPALPADATGQSARIEETGSLTLLVPGSDVESDLSRLTTLAIASGGFVASTQTTSAEPGSPAEGVVTLQVPEPDFGTVLEQVRDLGKVGSLTTNATDVTGQYVDLQSRITALEDSRQQYLTIMTNATSIGDVLSVQSQLDQLQSQLEQLQGQLQVLDSETTYASLTVTLAQRVAPAPLKPESGLASAWHGAVSGFVAGVEGVIRVAGPLLFALLLIAAVVLAGRWALSLLRQRRFTP